MLGVFRLLIVPSTHLMIIIYVVEATIRYSVDKKEPGESANGQGEERGSGI